MSDVFRVLLVFCISLSPFISCKGQENKINYSNIKEIKINPDKQDNLAEQVDDFKYIKLETSPESLIGNMDKVLFAEGRFYILDSKAQTLFVFNEDGHFSFKVRKPGRGVGEYIYLMDFDIDDQGNIYCLDLHQKAILKYDRTGRFIEKNQRDYFIYNIAALDPSTILTYQSSAVSSDVKHQFIFYKNNQKANSYLAIDHSKAIQMLKPFSIARSGNQLLYNRDLSDTIFSVSMDSLHARYYLNFGKYSIKPRLRTNFNYFKNKNIKKNEGYRISNYYEASDYFACTFYLKGFTWSLYHSLKSEKTLMAYCPDCDGTPQKVINDFMPIGVYKDFFISYLKFETIEKYKNEIRKDPERMRKLIGEENIKFINSIDILDNPVLILYKLKH